jgi:hypothetical protein
MRIVHIDRWPAPPHSPLRVDNFHAENFANAISWINYRRWWMEFVGFWGEPGAPPVGKAQPEGVSPVAFNTQATPAEYQQVYPHGSSTKFYLHSSTSPGQDASTVSPSPAPQVPETPVPEDPVPLSPSVGTETSPDAAGHPVAIGVVCFLLGIFTKYLLDCACDPRRGAGYSPINEMSI